MTVVVVDRLDSTAFRKMTVTNQVQYMDACSWKPPCVNCRVG